LVNFVQFTCLLGDDFQVRRVGMKAITGHTKKKMSEKGQRHASMTVPF